MKQTPKLERSISASVLHSRNTQKPTNRNKKKNKKGAGRKIFDGKNLEIVIQKLEEVWAIGGSDKEASFSADISPAALSDYLKKHPKITERKEALLNQPILKARQEVVKGLEGNPEFSLKYLERKLAKEFAPSQRIGLVGDENKPIEIRVTNVNTKKLLK